MNYPTSPYLGQVHIQADLLADDVASNGAGSNILNINNLNALYKHNLPPQDEWSGVC